MNTKEKVLLKTGKSLINLYINTLLQFDVDYEAAIDETHPNLFVPNHPTTTDPFFISKLTKNPFHILITANAFAIKGFGAYLEHSGHIPVKHGNGQEIVQQAIQRLEQGDSLAIFPEGKLSPQFEHPTTFRSGLGRIALATNTPITPIGIYAKKSNILLSNVMLETGPDISKAVIGGKYFITVGRPMHVFGNPDNYEDVNRVGAQVREEVQRLIRLSEARANQAVMPMPTLLQRFRNFLLNS